MKSTIEATVPWSRLIDWFLHAGPNPGTMV